MFEKPGRFIALTLALVIGALASMFIPDRPFRLGLDLQGGTRLVYRFDFEKALAEGKISEEEMIDRQQLLRDTSEIIRNRIDPQGILEASIRPEGEDRIVIELPGSAEFASAPAVGTLVEDISAGAMTLTLATDDEETLKSFPVSGGVIGIGAEKLRYERRDGAVLAGLDRGVENTPEEAHEATQTVRLLSDDAVRILIENTGDMQFFIAARPTDYVGTDEASERKKLDDWRAANPTRPVTEFNRVPPENGGPMARLRWYPMRQNADAPVPEELRTIKPLMIAEREDQRFSGDDLDTVGISQDTLGYPAVSFDFKPSKKTAFGEFTGQHIGDQMAIVLNDEIATDPVINSRLPGGGIIEGGRKGFTMTEVKDLVTVLRSGSLRIKPELEQEERVGATLGDDYVRKGWISSVLALALVMVFMAVYYRRLGIFAALTLTLNLLLLMGVLAFLRATLTLPGIAGLILTVGMAVDSNILIYERIREEKDRGLKIGQAVKNGFDRAFVAIFDMNVTTLLSAIILYKFGTGPVRGFATTLIIGILTTLFSVLIVTKLMVHIALAKGTKDFGMSRWVNKTKIGFMKLSRVAFPISMVLVTLGLAFFLYLPDRQKLGIDFLGGFTLTARMQDPQPVDKVRELVGGIEGAIGDSADVKAILSSGTKEGGYSQFRVTYKLGAEDEGTDTKSTQETGERAIRDALADVLQQDPVGLTVSSQTEGSTISGSLYFQEAHSPADLTARLAELDLEEVVVTGVADRVGAYDFTATSAQQWSTSSLQPLIANQFRDTVDSSNVEYALAEPIPETSIVGAQVSGELRDKAVQAVLLSLFVTVLYIRIRFREYAYGFAVVAALVHDVLIALGALALANWTGLVEAEINLAMVAAFLTIIGFSQNDTIVIFDRVRENLPRLKGSYEDVLNTSINQTLSRTLLTSGTLLISVMILFSFNIGTRNVLESFTFAILIGVVSGTYSTIFIACPILLWFERRGHSEDPSSSESSKKKEKATAAA